MSRISCVEPSLCAVVYGVPQRRSTNSCVEPSFCAVVYGVPQRRSANSVRHLMIHSTSSGQDVSECLGYDTGPFKHKRQLSSTVNKQHLQGKSG